MAGTDWIRDNSRVEASFDPLTVRLALWEEEYVVESAWDWSSGPTSDSSSAATVEKAR